MPYILFWVFVASAAIQLLFFGLVAIAIYRYKIPHTENHVVAGVSIVISAKNEYENLQRLIPLLLSQQYQQFEIVLVDDNSSDETYDYAIELDKKEDKFKLVRIDETPDHINNKKFALTLGIRSAKYDQILLTDADCFPQGDQWIAQMCLGFTSDQKKFVLGYSQYFETKGLLNNFITYETLLTGVHCFGIGLLGNPYMGLGRNMAYKKSFFLQHKGFGKYQGVTGGDDDLLVNQFATRSNTSFMLSPQSTMYSNPKTTRRDFVLQKTRHLSVGKHYRMADKLLLGILSLSKILFWLACFAAIMAGFQTYLVIGGFVLVMVSLLTALSALKKKTGDNSKIWLLPILDLIYIFYYISTGLKVLFTKKVRWK
ncbi:MAG: glycosyltransferase [Cyclobacteriaceae bacterium]|nr:glycosyltransferase [Cyclobacteriaceae bacterium]